MTQDIKEFEFRDEDDQYNFSTFKRRIKFLDGKWPIEYKYQGIIDDLEDLSIAKVFFGDYKDEYILEAKKRLPLLSKSLDSIIKEKKAPQEKFKSFERLRHQAEKIILERANKIEEINDELKSSKNLIIQHPKFNSKEFNKEGYELFKYLVEEFVCEKSNLEIKRGKSIRFFYIWIFFTDKNDKPEKISLNQKEYIKFIKGSYDIKITNNNRRTDWNNTEPHLETIKLCHEDYKKGKSFNAM